MLITTLARKLQMPELLLSCLFVAWGTAEGEGGGRAAEVVGTVGATGLENRSPRGGRKLFSALLERVEKT